MQLHEVKELQEASSVEHAEELIKAGWTLVAIVPGERYESGQKSRGPIYVLGMPEKTEPPKGEYVNGRWVPDASPATEQQPEYDPFAPKAGHSSEYDPFNPK